MPVAQLKTGEDEWRSVGGWLKFRAHLVTQAVRVLLNDLQLLRKQDLVCVAVQINFHGLKTCGDLG